MKKRIIFFDADGTLWYPKKTKNTRHPVWLYKDKRYKYHEKYIVPVPGVEDLLQKIQASGVISVILSTCPSEELIKQKLEKFELIQYFDAYYATDDFEKSKGEYIERILKERNISKKDALMVGDSYKWDYKPATDIGVDAVLIESDYEEESAKAENRIENITELIEYLDQ